MKKQYRICFLAIFIVSFLCTTTWAGGHGHKTPRKVGILLVAFGSSEPSAQVSFENIDIKTKTAFPGIPVYWAYTSHIIRKKRHNISIILSAHFIKKAGTMPAFFIPG